jgi:hypothetical protein
MKDQENMSDKEKFVQNLRSQVSDRQQENERNVAAFQQSSGTVELRAALEKVSVITGREAAEKALSIVADTNQDATVRVLALQKISVGAVDNRELINIALRILPDTTENIAVRKEAFKTLQTLTFSSRELTLMSADFKAALRIMLDDSNRELREGAAESLAQKKDEYVQRRLLDELKNKETKIVSRAKAIQLLGYDIHAEHFPIVREVLKDEKADETEKIEAIHVLASDSSSRDILRDLMADKKQSKEIRLSSASALHAVNPEDYVNIAKESVLDEKEDADIRANFLNGMRLHIENTSVGNDKQFVRRIESLRMKSSSPQLKEMSRKFVQDVKKRDKK